MDVFIVKDYDNFQVKVYFRVEQGDRTVIIGRNEEGMIESDVSDPTTVVKTYPILTLPMSVFSDFAGAFVSEINKQGIKTRDHNLIEGKLQAKEEHLNDIKTILFNKLGIDN